MASQKYVANKYVATWMEFTWCNSKIQGDTPAPIHSIQSIEDNIYHFPISTLTNQNILFKGY